MWIFLTRSSSFKRRANGFCSRDEVWVGYIGRRSRASVSGIDELDCARGSYQGNGREVEQARGIFDLRLLQPQSVTLHGSKHLLDAPAQAVEPHDLLCGSKLVWFTGNRQRGEQSPDDRLVSLGGIRLTHLHIGQRHGCGIGLRGSVARLGDAHASSLHTHSGDACGFTGPMRRNDDVHRAKYSPVRGRIEQILVIGELAILCGPYDQLGSWRNAGKLGIDVRFAVTYYDQLSGTIEKIGSSCRPLDPSERFLVLDRPRPTLARLLGWPRPDVGMHHAEHRLRIDIDRHHAMAEKTRRLPVACRSKTSPPAIAPTEIDFGRVLGGHNPPSDAGRRRSCAGRLDNLLSRHMRGREKTMCRHLSRSITTHLAQNQ